MNQHTAIVTLQNRKGLHARPSGKIAALVTQYQCELTICYEGKTADGSSLMDILLLAAPCGAELTLTAFGDRAEGLIKAITELVQDRFGEESV